MMTVQRIIFICLLVFLSGCVSTNSGPKGRKIDERKALESHIQLGMSYLQKRDRDRALRAFKDAQNIDSRSAEAMQGFALIHQLNGEKELADEKFKKAVKLKPVFEIENVEVSYAQFLYENDRCEEASTYLIKARKDISYPGRGKAIYMLGLCAKKHNDFDRAKASFEHALNLNKKNVGAAIELADISFQEREYADSKRYLDIYFANARRSARSLWLGIRIERIFGNKDKEASYVLALKNLHPYSKEYLEYKKLPK